MKPTLMKHNPAFLSRDELIKSFVVRRVDLDLIIETIKENTGNSNQHVLIIGPRGMGKTTLVLRAMASIAEDKELNSLWYPIVFSEESYEVSTPAEFWLRAIFHIAGQTKNESLAQAHERLKAEKDEKRLYERALSCLMDFADEQGKRLLLVVENLNMLFDDQINSDEVWDIRHTLLNEPRIMLLGTATSRFDGIDNAGKAMFDLFKIHYLEPLATQESKLLWEYLTGEEVKENKIRPIHILTGGNPRLLAIISSFAVGASFRELMKQLTSLIDEYTTYFKSNIESLPPLERKVFVTLANIWEPADSARVARDARIDVNKTSSLLKRLEFRGCVSALKSPGRKKSYQVTERLYNIYHLMRLSGSQSDRVRAVVDFMINFYEGGSLAKKLAELTADACYLDPEERRDHLEAYRVILKKVQDPNVLKRIIYSTKEEFLKLPDVSESLNKMIDQSRPNEENTEESLQKNLLENPNDSQDWVKYGLFLQEISKKSGEAEVAYRKAIEINSKNDVAWANLGYLLHFSLERYQEAEAAYRKAIEINPKDYECNFYLGILLREKLQRYEEAEVEFRKAIEINSENELGWVGLGLLLHEELERYVEAEKAYRKAIEIKPKEYLYHGQLGILLHKKLEKYEEAEAAYRKAIEINPNSAWAWVHLGQLLHEKLERYEEAEKVYRKAIEIDPRYDVPWANLGLLLHDKLGRYQEAEAAYRKAIEINPNYDWAWAHLGRLLHEKLDRYEEAEVAYRKVIEVDANCIWAWRQLIKIQIEQSNTAENIIDTITKCIEIFHKSAQCLNGIAWLIFKTDFKDGLSTAEKFAQEAVEKEPDSVYYPHTYASILGAQGKWEKALSVAVDFLKDPKSAKKFPNDIISFFTDAAAAGYAKEGLKLLKDSACAPYMEPLVVALQMLVGEETNAPQEVVEVAKDVLERIEEKAQNSKAHGADALLFI